jgi:hypothetical protein
MKKNSFLFVFILLANALSAAVIYVSPEGAGEESGSGWDNAARLSTSVLTSGGAGDEFWVKAGEYPVNIKFSNKKLYGGFAGTETERSQRNWAQNRTIIRGVASAQNPLASLSDGAVLDGFILQDNQNSTKNGGAIHMSSRCIVRNCIVRNNSVAGANVGGGIFVDGVVVDGVYPLVENCLIINNAAANNDGGIQVANGRVLRLINSTIANNKITKPTSESGSGFGCGVGLPVNAVLVAQNCIVYNNRKPDGAGSLIFSFGANHNMNNNTQSSVSNCAYDAINAGTGTQNGVVFASTTDCISDLSASKMPGFVRAVDFCGAVPDTETAAYAQFALANYGLTFESVCIDRGDNTAVAETGKDLANADRIYNNTVDMGAYEYVPAGSVKVVGKPAPSAAWNCFAENGGVTISGLTGGEVVSLYDLSGRKIRTAVAGTTSLRIQGVATGIYLINVNKMTRKINCNR